MNINKNRKKSQRYTYDGTRIIKKGSKELYSFVYKRVWDLTQYDKKLLQNYGLEPCQYVYIGSSNKYNLNDRNSHWRYEILKNSKNVSKEIKLFLSKLKILYRLETRYTDDEINELLYYSSEIIARCESLQGARSVESHWTSYYHELDSLGEIKETPIILLSKKDSNLRENKNEVVSILRLRNLI